MHLELNVNGQKHQVNVDPDTPLLYVLRNDLGLKSAKFACGLEQCGACKVIIDGRAVPSCRLSVRSVQGAEITTLEGIGTRDALHPKKQGNDNNQNTKSQTTAHAARSCLGFGCFSLKFACDLVLDVCDFSLLGLKLKPSICIFPCDQTSPCTTLPPFIIRWNDSRSVRSAMSFNGLPSTTTRSANLPSSMVPSSSSIPMTLAAPHVPA